MVLVSVLMGSYNHEKYIAEAVENVLNQTFPDLELVIVDDGSTDNSPKIIQEYQKTDPRVHAFFHQENRGIPQTMNECLAAAQGKFVSFIGSDDLWVISKLEKQLAVLSVNEDLIVWSEGEVIDAQGAPNGAVFTEINACGNKPKSGRIFKEIICENYIFGQSALFKREFCRNLFFNRRLKYLSDFQFWADLAFEHEFLFMSEPLAKYRIHGKNTLFRDKSSWLKDRIYIRNYFLQRYGGTMSRHLKGTQYLRIGEAYAGLGRQDTAKRYFMKALRADFLSKQSILYFAYAFSAPKSLTQKALVKFYLKL